MPRSAHRSISLRHLIWFIAIGPTLLAGGIVLLLSERAADSIANSLAERFITEAQGRVRQQVSDYLRSAVIASDLTAQRIARGELNPESLDAWLRPTLDQIR